MASLECHDTVKIIDVGVAFWGRLRPGKKDCNMIRSQLVQKLAALNPGLSGPEVDKIVDIVFDSIGGRLADGGRVELRGFGAFTTRARDGRTGRNPRTGAAVVVPSKRVPHFKPGKEMRLRLNAEG